MAHLSGSVWHRGRDYYDDMSITGRTPLRTHTGHVDGFHVDKVSVGFGVELN